MSDWWALSLGVSAGMVACMQEDDLEPQLNLRSRPLGVGLLAVGVVLLAYNYFTVMATESLDVRFLVGGGMCVPVGIFGSIFGWTPDFRHEPVWWQAGAWASVVLGLSLAVGIWYYLT